MPGLGQPGCGRVSGTLRRKVADVGGRMMQAALPVSGKEWSMRIGLGVFLMLAATPAVAADQFDLVCEGTRQLGVNEPVKPLKYGLRIDLSKRQWCWDHCEEVYPIQEVREDRIILRDVVQDTLRKRITDRNIINRQTGDHNVILIETRPYQSFLETIGSCEPVAFTGFPKTKF